MSRILFSLAALLCALMPLVFDSALKGAALLAVAALTALAMWRASAATRHLVWLVAVVALLVVPVFSVALPQWRVLPAWAVAPVAVEPAAAASRWMERTHGTKRTGAAANVAPDPVPLEATLPDAPAPAAAPVPPAFAPHVPPLASHERSRTWRDWLPFAWLAGFTLLALRLLAAHILLRLAARGCRVVVAATSSSQDVLETPRRRGAETRGVGAAETCCDEASQPRNCDGGVAATFAAACAQLGIRGRVTLLLDGNRTIPVVWGVFCPRLLLPAEARGWSGDQLRSVLLHELAHIKRRDTLVQWLTQIACALHWWNPLVWLAAWRLHAERERACDDLVLASGVRPSAYAEHLLHVATKLSPARWTAACGLAMARKSSLEGRLLAVLSEKLNRRGVTSALAAIALLLGAGIAIPVAMLRAADEKWNPPSGGHIGGNDFSAFCIHDGKDTSFVIAYHGDFDSSSRSYSNAKTRTWNNDVTLTAKKPNIALSFLRTHTAPGKLRITTTPAEGRDLSKPASAPRDFGQKEYDLAKGRVFLLTDTGLVRQFDLPTPPVTDRESADKLAKLIAAVPPQVREDVAPARNATGKLAPETDAKLKWGEPVNGLRMALAWPPALGDAFLGTEDYFQLVVQNVSEKEVHFLTGDDAPNPRSMRYREGERIVQALSDKDAQKTDWQLAPSECGVLRLFSKEERGKDGKTISTLIEGDLAGSTRYHAVAIMEVAKAPAGAWTGKLTTGQTRGSADKADAPAPKHKDARALYEIWQRHARANGDIPGALVGGLATAVKTFIGYNPTWETVPKLNTILPRLDATHDWKAADAIALLDEVAAVKDSPLSMAMRRETRHTIRNGEKLPEKFADSAWSGGKANGLRAAWVLEPGAAEHRIGAALKARLLVWNPGAVPVMLQVPTWHQGTVKATDAKGAEVQASGLEWTTLAQLFPCRLGPGEFIEINTPGVGLGPRAGNGPWAGPRVGSNVLTKPGDELTLTHSPVPLDGSGVGRREDDPHVAGPGWWDAHIKARLSHELPLPADAAERTRLLDRVVRDLFATAPTAEEIAAFIADKTPDALDALVKRLASREDVVSFSGKLQPAPAKFRVLAADSAADKIPRVVLGPGEYPVSDKVTLKIVGRPVGDRRTNDAELRFAGPEPEAARPLPPHKLNLPDGWGTWAIVCRPSDGFLYVLHKGEVRKIDYSNPAKVTDAPASGWPAEFRDEAKRQLEIHGVSDAQQAEIVEMPAAPAATPAPKTAEASPPEAPAPGPLQPITDGRSSAQVLRTVGQEPVVILTGRALTASPGSTSREGSVTMEVATSDKTITIRYTWPEEAPGILDLKVGGYPVSRFDLSRGRVFFVHFEKLEFSADVFQVPAAVKVPAITSPETLTQAAAAVTAWHGASDTRALWECSRIVVPEREYKTGQPLDAAAGKIVWGEVNDVGLRLGLGGLEPGASFPVGQQLPVKQYIRNDSTNTLTLSPTQIFNEGVGGELVRMADGKKFPHKKGYPWQGFFHRVRLAPGYYIALGSGPMSTIMAEKDGSSPGGMDMMAHGFTVLPGEYTLQLTHDIGQLQGRPVNFHFADPRGAPGLGEWTGVLKSAAVPLRLVDEQVKTARAGGSETFGRYMIAFDKGVLKLRHYNGYPNMALVGGPWEDGSRDWKIPAADGEYVAAWAVGGKGLWVKDASGITHLIVKENLTETGRWTLDQASGGLGNMPAGVRAALQLPPAAASQPFDFKKLPSAPGAAKISGDFFEMALSPGTVLKVPHKGGGFFIESGGNAYGPAEGNPVVELGLTELLRARLSERPNTAGLDMLRHMIADGRGAIRDCAFRLLEGLKAPQAPFDYDAVFHAMIGASIEDEHGPKELTPEAHLGYARLHNLFHSNRLEWERTRPVLAAGSYQPGEALGADPAIVWTPGPDGMSLGVSGLPADTNLETGKSMPVAVYLRNDSTAPVKLSVPAEHNPGIQISLSDKAGKTHRAIYPFSPPLAGYSHHQLAPGTGAKVAAFDLEACATPEEADRAKHKEGKAHNPRLAVPVGSYELHLEYRNYQENPVPKGAASEWTGKVSAKPVPMKVAAAIPKSAASPRADEAPLKPKHEYAQSLFRKWQANARTDGKIPGALIGHVAREVDGFLKQHPDDDKAPQLAALRPRLDASRDWAQAEVVALLDDITAISTAPVSWADIPIEFDKARAVQGGEALPIELTSAAWGQPLANGLRAAWLLEPRGEQYALGSVLKARVLFHNAGKAPVVFKTETWHQYDGHTARDAKGAEIKVSGPRYTGITPMATFRLAPGEFCEVLGHGIAIGAGKYDEEHSTGAVGAIIEAKEGDAVTLSHTVDTSHGGWSRPGDPKDPMELWKATIAERIANEAPMPASAADRAQLIRRVTLDIFGVVPTPEEIAAFTADDAPDALAKLAARLQAKQRGEPFSGKLPTGETKFRVIAADPNAAKAPRTANAPGRYVLAENVHLLVSQISTGERRENKATIAFLSPDPKVASPHKPHEIALPDGIASYAFTWDRGTGKLWLVTKGVVRSYDFTNPSQVQETRYEPGNVINIPEHLRAPLKESRSFLGGPVQKPAKLAQDALLGFWRGKMNDRNLMLSFHRPPVETNAQLDIYFGEATIGAPASFAIAADGESVAVMQHSANGRVPFGTLRPGEAGVLKLELDGRQQGQTEVTLTRDADEPATEPRQKEARELFALWKRTANDDGTIPGTFIGMLAAEVRAYVKANPNLDSGMKLPKLLPRFVTSREWTAAEAIKLLDDVAYYATAPIEARVAKCKLPSGPLWRTMVSFEDIPVAIAKWSEAKDGLRIGMRVVEGEWRVGGKVRVELWLHNAGGKDVSFKSTGPDRQDVGVVVSAVGAGGREHWAEGGNVLIIAFPMDCTMPAGHVAKAKVFELTFAEPGNKELAWFAPRFRALPPGKYQLRCKWVDAHPTVSKPGDWTGELVAPEFDFVLAALGAADAAR